MSIGPIRSDEEHQIALGEIKLLMNSKAGTVEGARLDALADVVEAYESVRYPFAKPSARDAILFRMDSTGLNNEDLVPIFGSMDIVRDILNGKTSLTREMALKLHASLKIPMPSLIPTTI